MAATREAFRRHLSGGISGPVAGVVTAIPLEMSRPHPQNPVANGHERASTAVDTANGIISPYSCIILAARMFIPLLFPEHHTNLARTANPEWKDFNCR